MALKGTIIIFGQVSVSRRKEIDLKHHGDAITSE